jgi:hypothetical protein
VGQTRNGEPNLVEPEGVNAGSADALRDEPGVERDVVSGAAPEKMREPPPPSTLLGPPTDEDIAYGSEPVGGSLA